MNWYKRRWWIFRYTPHYMLNNGEPRELRYEEGRAFIRVAWGIYIDMGPAR